MGAPDLLARLQALGVRLTLDGEHLIAEPRSALTDDARAMIRANKAELLAALQPRAKGQLGATAAERRKAKALAFLEAHPNAKRACFVDLDGDPANVVLTVAIREPWMADEVLVSRARFDALALMELSLRYPATSLFVPEH